MFLFIVTMCSDYVRSPYFAVVMLYRCSKLASLRRQVLVRDLHLTVWREGEKAVIVSFPMEVEIMSELGPGDLARKSKCDRAQIKLGTFSQSLGNDFT